MNACTLCGGTAGHIGEHDAHVLCWARNQAGLPTPKLGDRCPACNGRGHTSSVKGGLMLGFDLGPSRIRRAIDAAFPKCTTCDGTGAINRGGSR